MKRRLIFAALSLPAAIFGRGTPQVVIESRIVEVGPGILSANFGTSLGNLYANFPSDLAPGDRISGTFATLPKGTKEAERTANAAALSAMTIEICGSDFSVATGLFVCPRVSEDSLRIVLSEIVSMEGGEEQSITIVPAEVSAAGTFAISRRLSGNRRGDYRINVSIPWSEESFRNPAAE